MGNSDSIDINLSNLYRSWYAFRKGKRKSSEILSFEYSLEQNLVHLQSSLVNLTYKHGSYAHFEVNDSKRREIAVAPVRDRVVHRLLYDYLEPRWDKAFIFDAWSCRKNKGLHAATERAADFMRRYQNCWVWRSDITKFFDSVDQELLLNLVRRRIACETTLWLIGEVLDSYWKNQPGRGMPIGNLTSQVFANIYLNEFDRYMVHELKPLAYMRYGDDWLCITQTKKEAECIRTTAVSFLGETLKLQVSRKVDATKPAYKGFTFLGVDHWPGERRLTKSTQARVYERVRLENYSSYEALIKKFSNQRSVKKFYWQTLEI